MARADRFRILALASLLTLGAALAHAGQVRVDVGPSSTDFTQGGASHRVANINLGDHLVWVWVGAALHTVTSGDSATGVADGTFNSDPSGFGTGQLTRFAWKSTGLGTFLYFCGIHLPDMAARIVVHDPVTDPVPVADFRLTEVQYNRASGQDLIEITNYGAATGNLGRFRINSSGSGVGTELPVTNVTVPPGGRVVIRLNATGTNTNTDVFIPSFVPGTGLPDASGALALYVPNTISPGNALTNSAMILDFVQWGAGAQPNQTTAVNAGFWTAGEFIPTVAADRSIEYCADAEFSHGASRWVEVSVPNFGTDGNCSTPVSGRDATWGRVKQLYR